MPEAATGATPEELEAARFAAGSHRARAIAESFGADAERYDRTRPHYPGELVARIAAASPGRSVLDVGTGTGIAARQFQAAGCRVLGVEPDPRGWPPSPVAPESTPRWRRSRTGTAPGAALTRSSPGRPGTGWIPWPAR